VSISIPPKANELEISIFGPGRGESVLIHLGNDEWCVVDSCIARGRRQPAALEYLEALGTNAAGVKLVVATHWHNDHINGLSTIVRQAPSAKFCCSMALKRDEFTTLISSFSEGTEERSGVDELSSILSQLRQTGRLAPMWAVENKRLLHWPDRPRAFPISVTTLSPSDVSITLALREIAGLIPAEGKPQRRIVNRSPNHASVVLWLQAGAIRALLGADLEHSGRVGEGWMAIIASHQDSTPGVIFKVPHHGSPNGDCPEVWEKLLAQNSLAVVTPFTGGRVRLPRDSDLERLSGRTTKLYCTAAGAGKPPSRDPSVERSLRTQLRDRRVVAGQPGHVRMRWSATSETAEPKIELFNGAYHVPSVVS